MSGPRSISASVLRAGPVALALVAESAWISVVANLVQVYSLNGPSIGLPAMLAFVAGGWIAGSRLGPRIGDRWPGVASGLALGAGAVGWLAAPDARAALGAGSVAASLGVNPGGWLAAIAVVRGYRHVGPASRADALAAVLAVGIPGIAFAAILGGMIAEPLRGPFLSNALVAATVFVASGTLALALARLAAIGAEGGFDWRRNPPWLGLVAVLVVAVALVAVPVATAAGPIVTLVLGVLAGPFLLVGFVLGFTRRTAWILLVAGVATAASIALILVIDPQLASPGDVGRGVVRPSEPAGPREDDVLALTGLILVAAAAAIAILVRLWMARRPGGDDIVDETRTIDRGDDGQPGRTRPGRPRSRFRRTRRPTDAVAAYRALDEELRGTPLGRRVDETPGEHARRLRTSGATGLSLDLLAADYALARFGAVALTPAEDRRAVARWRALRTRLAEGSFRRVR